jgi:FMN phosphatase YigB (HAD superfamily)
VEDALSIYNRDDIPGIVPYPDAIASLEAILDENKIILLVTTGRRNRQLAKVEQLGLSRFFEPDGNLFVHEPDTDHPTKKAEMLQALASARLSPKECISIGDKLDADVTLGNLIGMTTVRIRKGRQRNWDPSTDDETPDHNIRELIELVSILQD